MLNRPWPSLSTEFRLLLRPFTTGVPLLASNPLQVRLLQVLQSAQRRWMPSVIDRALHMLKKTLKSPAFPAALLQQFAAVGQTYSDMVLQNSANSSPSGFCPLQVLCHAMPVVASLELWRLSSSL